jgi:hypothetical protein
MTRNAFGFSKTAGAASALLFVMMAHSVQGQSVVVLNELVADNRSGLENSGDYPDWVELYNTSGGAINLEDWSLSDDPTAPRKFVFPVGTAIPANGFLVIYCDERTNSAGLHTGFGLSDKGETLALFASGAMGGVMQDQVTFGLQLRDRSIGRVPSGIGDFSLTTPTPSAHNIVVALGNASTLKINEWSALNGKSVDAPDPDWFELYNPDPNPVALAGLVLTDQTTVPPVNPALAALSFIEGRGFVQLIADDKTTPADNVNFKLSSTSGDRILLYQPDRVTLVDSVSFGAQSLNISQGRLPDGSPNLVSFGSNQPTPAASNFLPLTDVVFNEVLTRAVPPLEDAIELLNLSGSPLDLSHWWLSDSRDQPNKFRIPAGTVLAPGGFVVFYEGVGTTRGFNASGTGQAPDFALNAAHGGELYLFSADADGSLTGSRGSIDYGPAENGVSFGRYVLSTGEGVITAMSQRTFGVDSPGSVEQFRNGIGLPNATPKVGPVVISELYYHPPDIVSGTNLLDNSIDEFIELQNITSASVALFDSQYPLNAWRLRGGVDFDFPPNRSLAAGASLLLVNFDPANATLLSTFREKFQVPASVAIWGPYQGKLANGGATVQLQRPDTPQQAPNPDAGYVPHITVDRVKYEDAAPWPATADGQGDSLQRVPPDAFGSEPLNWTGAPPSAGLPGVPTRIQSFQRQGQTLTICFRALAGRTYSVQTSGALNASTWTKVADVTATVNGDQCVDTTLSPSDNARFFRLATAQP